ncbi:hypothetical protein K2D_00280 [Planctomycetes bacterium K2D]|uniref:Dockerin domain-containing protein n=2 Tax=Botrimarina mediterranea TaxID=2528022 RepID=A0A518K2B4_9BACT|nr:hypothetical protein Spa11_00780 [Botrimarina mediterranea]QDV76450.1 hypothetical protein K2D_00280 [Planctomycetes bacterium K2D]
MVGYVRRYSIQRIFLASFSCLIGQIAMSNQTYVRKHRQRRQIQLIGFATAMLGLAVPMLDAATAAELGFTFTGLVAAYPLPGQSPFGLPVASVGTPVRGHFVYDTSLTPTYDLSNPNKAAFRSVVHGGFAIEIDGVAKIVASDYAIQVANNVTQPSSGAVTDLFGVSYSDALVPAPTIPLLMNGHSVTQGALSINFVAPPNLMDAPELPGLLSLEALLAAGESPFHFVTDTTKPFLFPKLVFAIDSIEFFDPRGDFNFDFVVDEHDLSLWTESYGSSNALSADGNRDGVIDAADYTVWRDRLASIAAVVPEPSAMVVALAAIPLLVAMRCDCSED